MTVPFWFQVFLQPSISLPSFGLYQIHLSLSLLSSWDPPAFLPSYSPPALPLLHKPHEQFSILGAK